VPQQKMVVLDGSQTGNAAEIAKGINAEAVQRKLPSSVFAMSEFSVVRSVLTQRLNSDCCWLAFTIDLFTGHMSQDC